MIAISKKKHKGFLRKAITIITSFLLVISMSLITSQNVSAYSLNNLAINNMQTYESGCLKSIDIAFTDGGYGKAYCRFSVNTQSIEGLTDFGNYNSVHRYSDWPSTPADCGFVCWNEGGTFERTSRGNIKQTISFQDGIVDLNNENTYYIYMWAAYGGEVYPDYKMTTLKVENKGLTVDDITIPVTNIKDVPSEATVNVELPLTGIVEPSITTKRTIVWSIDQEGDTGASITNNTFKATQAGTAKIKATIVDGKGTGDDYTQTFDIAVNETIAPTYAITYNSNGGSGSIDEGTATENVAFTLPANAFTAPKGKQFKCWAIGSADGTQVNAGATYTFTEATTVYAIWEDTTIPDKTDSPATGDNTNVIWWIVLVLVSGVGIVVFSRKRITR